MTSIARFASLAAVLSMLAGCGSGADLTLVDPDVVPTSELEASLSAARVAALDDSPYGVNSHGGPADMLETFAGIGLRWHRVDAEWPQIEKQEGVFDWSLQDTIIESKERLGLHLMGTLSYTPGWASGGSDPALAPRVPGKFVNFVREFTRRYRGKFGCLGVWNEPNLRQFWKGTKSQYINDILVPSLKAIREEAPEQALCGPDLSSSGDERNDWLKPILASEAGALFDIIAHHQYDGSDTVSGRVSEVEKLRAFLQQRGQGNKPVWITETGWGTQGQAAAMLPGWMAAMGQRSAWWTKTFWYDSHGGEYGLLGPDGSPERVEKRASFYKYQDVIAAAGGNPAPTPTPAPAPTPTGESKTVHLRSWGGSYVVAEGGGGDAVNANRDGAGPWETFSLITISGTPLADGSTVQLRTHSGAHYLMAEQGGGSGLHARSTNDGAWETFTLVKVDGDRVALKTLTGHYLVAEGGGGGVVNANRTAIGPWETFTLTVW
ncbi:MAG: fascin domain-containing protein [Myxococcaceae bacterium]